MKFTVLRMENRIVLQGALTASPAFDRRRSLLVHTVGVSEPESLGLIIYQYEENWLYAGPLNFFFSPVRTLFTDFSSLHITLHPCLDTIFEESSGGCRCRSSCSQGISKEGREGEGEHVLL